MLQLNFALRDLPKFTCLDSPNVYRGTIHILPEGPDIWENIRTSFRECSQGKLPQRPCIEWYTHTVVDPSLQDKDGHHSAALFVDSVPYELANSTWDEEKDKYSDHLLSILDDFAPGMLPDSYSYVHCKSLCLLCLLFCLLSGTSTFTACFHMSIQG